MGNATVFLAEGFELCEALMVVDILKRAGTAVTTAAVGESLTVKASCGVSVTADMLSSEADYSAADMIVLPGGIPGAYNLAASPVVRKQCVEFARSGKKVAAICASPSVVLCELGLLEGKRATVNPGFADRMPGAVLTCECVTVDGNITTAQALGSSMEFGLELARQLEGDEVARKLRAKICVPG